MDEFHVLKDTLPSGHSPSLSCGCPLAPAVDGGGAAHTIVWRPSLTGQSQSQGVRLHGTWERQTCRG